MRCQVLSPFSQALDTSVFESATIPTKGGIITVLPGHESMISALAPGVLHVKAWEQTHSFAIGGGLLEVNPDSVRILVDTVDQSQEQDLEAIRNRKEAIRKDIESYRTRHEMIDMEKLLEMEYDYLKESAREQLALSRKGK